MAKAAGRLCGAGEYLLELETDKVNVELTAEESGVLKEVLKDSGDTVQVGEVIGTIAAGEAGGSESAAPAPEQASAPASKEEPAAAQKEEAVKEEPKAGNGRTIASPAARKLAREKG